MPGLVRHFLDLEHAGSSAAGAWIAALAVILSAPGCAQHSPTLPYGPTNPVIYDNDEAVDMYTDEYLLSLASRGEIQLRGILTSSPTAPFDSYVPAPDYERFFNDRTKLLENAVAGGFANIPPSKRGPIGNLEKPASGKIEDTRPIGSAGTRFILEEARKASPDAPLVIVVGTALTAEADAYLTDPSIANRVIVAWLGGRKTDMCDYNGWADPWAAYIVLQNLRLVQFPLDMAPPVVRKKDLLTLHESPLRSFMYDKHHPTNGLPGDVDADCPPAISLTRRDYPLSVKPVKFKNWVRCRMYSNDGSKAHDVPGFASTGEGTTLVVAKSDQHVATTEWWRAIRNALTQ